MIPNGREGLVAILKSLRRRFLRETNPGKRRGWVQETNTDNILKNDTVPEDGLVEPSNRNVWNGKKKPQPHSNKWRTNEQRKGTKRRVGTESKGLSLLPWSLSRDFSGSRLGPRAFETKL